MNNTNMSLNGEERNQLISKSYRERKREGSERRGSE